MKDGMHYLTDLALRREEEKQQNVQVQLLGGAIMPCSLFTSAPHHPSCPNLMRFLSKTKEERRRRHDEEVEHEMMYGAVPATPKRSKKNGALPAASGATLRPPLAPRLVFTLGSLYHRLIRDFSQLYRP
jgi:hypothetical protein